VFFPQYDSPDRPLETTDALPAYAIEQKELEKWNNKTSKTRADFLLARANEQ
jgi:hypothetical protein